MSAGFLLDTNVVSETLRPVPHTGVTAWVQTQSDIQFLSVVSIGELRRGASRTRFSPPPAVPLTPAGRQAEGQPLGIADGLIAATALEHDLALVTRNVKDFRGIGVAVFNPWELS